MKKISILALALTGIAPAFAGTPVMSSKEVFAPAPEPCLATWFAGGSVGYLVDFEEAYYSAHVGTDTCWNVGGWDVALFAEVGYTEAEETFFVTGPGTAPSIVPAEIELQILPVTANVKFERYLNQRTTVYLGAGLGAANVDLSVSSTAGSLSADDWVFAAQVFGGFGFDMTEDFELFTGARWLYLDDADLAPGLPLELGDDVILEVGGRFNF